MNSEKTIRSYIMPGAGRRVIAWLLTFIVVAAAGMFGYSKYCAYTDPAPAVDYDKIKAEENAYVYLDIVAVSNRLCSDDGKVYYCAVDEQGEKHLVVLSDSVFKQMSAQNDYMMSAGDGEAPDSFRICAIVCDADREVINSVMRAMSMGSAEYYHEFGFNVIDTEMTPVDVAGKGWEKTAFIFLIVWLFFGLPCFLVINNARKCIRRLNELGSLDAAAAELNDEKTVRYGEDYMRLSANYYYGAQSGVAVHCDDVLLVYKNRIRRRFETIAENLVIGTKTCGTMKASSIRKDEYSAVDRVALTFAERNANVLVGDDDNNIAKYRQLVKQLKRS